MMNKKKILLGIVGALATAAGAVATLVSEVLPNNSEEKEAEAKTEEEEA